LQIISVLLFEMLQLISTLLSQDRQAKWITPKSSEKSNVINVVRWKAALDQQRDLKNIGQLQGKI